MNRYMYEYMFKKFKKEKNPFFDDSIPTDSLEVVLKYLSMSSIKQNLLREHYDGDSYYFFRNENNIKNHKEKKLFSYRGDTMISFFTPYKWAIKNKTGITYNKNQIDLYELIKNKNKDYYLDVNIHFYKFANLYHSRGNLILLPKNLENIPARMNPDRYSCSEDRIDKSLYECFPGGILSKYFENNLQKVQEWIKKEHLEMFFKGDISKENIIKFTSLNEARYYRKMSTQDIYTFINHMVDIIEKRNEYFAITI
ncbi:MAG: hypothetical protein ACRC7N_16410 [Clostridium sp.]